MKRTIALKVYKSLREGLKTGYNHILYYRTQSEYEEANKDINDVLNSNLELVCCVDGDVATKLVRMGLVEFKKTKVGDCCCVLTDDDNLLDERSVLTIAAFMLSNPMNNEKHLSEILESFSVVGEYEISFEYLGITVNVSSMYQDELDECDDLTEDDADYIIDMNGLRFYIFNI